MRYNVGGCGRCADGTRVATLEKNSAGAWYKTVEGFGVDWLEKGVDSPSYDWCRDPRQRQAVAMALERGVVHHVEMFHNAPPWWMTHEKTSFGGSLQHWNRSNFALYAANVAQVQHTGQNNTVNCSTAPCNTVQCKVGAVPQC